MSNVLQQQQAQQLQNYRPQSESQRNLEARAYDSTMRIFGRYNCDPRTAHPEQIAKTMARMNVDEIECIATAQRLVMKLNGINGGMRLDG